MFLGGLLRDDLGVIVCSNIVDGLDERLYDGSFAKEALDWWDALCQHKGITAVDRAVYELRSLAFDAVLRTIPATFRPGMRRPRFSFIAQRKPRGRKRNGLVATVMPADRLRDKMSSRDLYRFENTLGVNIPDAPAGWTPDVLTKVQGLAPAERVFTIPSTKPLHPLCLWFTREEELRQCLRGAGNASNIARDVLGLVHYAAGTPLAVLYFPYQELAIGDNDRPTFIEAANNRRFKARADLTLSKKQKSWGHAADLRKVAIGHSPVDGCPERIARPALHSFQLRFEILGATSGTRGIAGAGDSDAAFADILVACARASGGARTKNDIEARLRSLP